MAPGPACALLHLDNDRAHPRAEDVVARQLPTDEAPQGSPWILDHLQFRGTINFLSFLHLFTKKMVAWVAYEGTTRNIWWNVGRFLAEIDNG